jgi:tetratricopeptide (TPR) repeat protein
MYGRMPDADARSSRGFALLKMGRASDALAEFDRALALAPGHADALLGRGLALEASGRPPEEAIAALRAFLRQAPNHPAAAEARARLDRLAPGARRR